MPNKDLIFRLLNLNRVLLWGSVFRGEGSGTEDNFLNSGCCAGPRSQAGKIPPLSPATSCSARSCTHCFSGHFMRWSSGRNKAKEYEYSGPRRVSCGETCFSAAGARKVACRDVGRTRWEPSLPISQVVEIMPGCAVLVTRLPPPLGRAEKFGMGWVGHFWRKQPRRGFGCSGVPCQGAVHFLHLLHLPVG